MSVNPHQRVFIIGAGGHAKVVADILLLQGYTIVGYLDDNPAAWDTRPLGLPVLGSIDSYAQFNPDALALGIGANHVRRALFERIPGLWINAIHPTATIASSVQMGQGIVAAAHSVINPDTKIGNGVIINTGATVDHDCNIGDYAHIAPGAHLAGSVVIGSGTLVGIGAQIVPSCSVGERAIIGAGATVIGDVPPHVTAVGTPARW